MPYPYRLRKLVKESRINEKIELTSETCAFIPILKSNIKTDNDIKNQYISNSLEYDTYVKITNKKLIFNK